MTSAFVVKENCNSSPLSRTTKTELPVTGESSLEYSFGFGLSETDPTILVATPAEIFQKILSNQLPRKSNVVETVTNHGAAPDVRKRTRTTISRSAAKMFEHNQTVGSRSWMFKLSGKFVEGSCDNGGDMEEPSWMYLYCWRWRRLWLGWAYVQHTLETWESMNLNRDRNFVLVLCPYKHYP